MGAADYPVAPLLSEELPILSKLQDYGFSEDTDTPILLAPILDSMDTKGLWLLERLVSDLADFSDSTQGLKNTVSELTAQLEQEKQTNQYLKAENVRLDEENARMRAQIDQFEGKEQVPKSSSRAEEEEEQLRQWRTQSLHQLQELERMNQALRAALSRHTCATPPITTTSNEMITGKEKPCGGYIVLSQVLAPLGAKCSMANESNSQSSEQKNHTTRVPADQCQEIKEDSEKVEEKQSDLQRLLMETQEELSTKNQEIVRLSSLVEASAKMLQTVNEGTKEKIETQCLKEASDTVASMNKQNETLREQECIIAGLRSQLAQKIEQLSFITDEKVVGEEALGASQLECKQLSSLLKELDERMAQLQTALETRTKERDNAIAAEKQATEARQLSEEGLQKKCNELSDNLQALQEHQKLIQQERDESRRKEEEARLKCIQLLADLQICQYGSAHNNVNHFPARSFFIQESNWSWQRKICRSLRALSLN